MLANLTISRPSHDDAPALLAFELANRDYFERAINGRGEAYYDLTAVRREMDEAQRDAEADTAHRFLIKHDDDIVGRVNLATVMREHFNKASLGYRIGAAWAGRGYASRAVELVLQLAATELGLWRVEATARPDNLGSVRVLERSGFTVFGRSHRCLHLHDQWHDLLHFERFCAETPAYQAAPYP